MALINCPNCNETVSDRAEKCIHCGYMLNSAASSGVTGSKPKKRKAGKIFLVLFILLILGGGAATAIYFLNTNKEEVQPSESQQEDNSQVEEIISAIDGLGEISINSKSEVDKINTMYNALSEEDKSKITNYEKLVTANNKIAMLQVAEDSKKTSDKPKLTKSSEKEAFIKIIDALDSASQNVISLSEACNDVDLWAYQFNSNSWKLDSAKKSLQKAYDLCGIYKKFSKLKKTIKKAIDDAPSTERIGESEVVDKLNSMTIFLQDMREINTEVVDIADSY